MKTIIQKLLKTVFLFSLFLSLFSAHSQIYSGMTYQAVIRNSSNAIVANTGVSVKISILQGTSTGTVVFSEKQLPTTNANGLATFVIGTGTVLSGDFWAINWTNGPYFIKTETDPTGGSTYSISGTSQLNTVPYALFSENSLYATYSGDSWKKTGNVVDLTTDFIGSTNDVDIVFKRNNLKAGKIGLSNTAFGLEALNSNTSTSNSAFGTMALQNNTSGQGNVAVGSSALKGTTTILGTGSNNVALGFYALENNTSGNGNVAIGRQSLQNNINGYTNIASGGQSLLSNTDGFANVANGYNSLRRNITGDQNTAIGNETLEFSTGNLNVALGYGALGNLTTGNGNIGIGKFTNVPTPTTDNQLSIGNVIYGSNMGNTATGTIGIGVPVPTEKLEVAGKTKTTSLQVTNGAGANKILTSDVTGNATWQTSNINTGIHITKTTNQIIVPNITTTIDFSNEQTDDANAFNPTTDEWIIPSTGFYHINVSSRFNPALPVNYQATLHLYVNGVSTKFKGHLSSGSIYQNFDFSTDVKLNANDIVTIRIVQNTLSGTGGANATLSGISGDNTFYLSGFKVY
jgi:trimeric autotransporter adhesin